MTIIGRTTKDAVVNTLNDGRKVVNFSIAVNYYYRPKGGEAVKNTTYYDCAYWVSEKLAANLKKGTLVEASGRVYLSAYTAVDSSARASLKCHVSGVKIHVWPKDATPPGQPQAAVEYTAGEDDLPF